MRGLRRICAWALAVLASLLLALPGTALAAGEAPDGAMTERLADGFSAQTRVSVLSVDRAAGEITGQCAKVLCAANGKPLFSVVTEATFRFDGQRAAVADASTHVCLLAPGVRFEGKSAFTNGTASVYGSATCSYFGTTRTIGRMLRCSPTGELSAGEGCEMRDPFPAP